MIGVCRKSGEDTRCAEVRKCDEMNIMMVLILNYY
jgi:hypothetical protein